MPGTYALTYTVANDVAVTASAKRQLVVYQAAALSVSFTLWTGVANATQAQDLVAGVQNTTSQAYVDALQLVLSKLGPDAPVDASDIDITAASYEQHAASNFSVAVNATLYAYSPAGIHRSDVRTSVLPQAQQPASGGSATRHLLQDHGSAHGSHGAVAPAPAAVGLDVPALGAVWQPAQRGRVQALAVLQQSLGALSAATARSGCAPSSSSCVPARHTLLSADAPLGASAAAAGGAAPQRRLLQASSNAALADVLQSLTGALGNLGASNVTTEALTAQAVDLLTVSVHAPASSPALVSLQPCTPAQRRRAATACTPRPICRR
jgi:hypothetical protein